MLTVRIPNARCGTGWRRGALPTTSSARSTAATRWTMRRATATLPSPVRAIVESIFGTLKTVCGLRWTRLLGLARNRCQWTMAAIGWNLAKAARFHTRYG